jgi:hypothetical protein
MPTMELTQFKRGMYVLHDHPNFNFQLNRTVMWGGGDVEEVCEAAKRITSLVTWATELRALGEAGEC